MTWMTKSVPWNDDIFKYRTVSFTTRARWLDYTYNNVHHNTFLKANISEYEDSVAGLSDLTWGGVDSYWRKQSKFYIHSDACEYTSGEVAFLMARNTDPGDVLYDYQEADSHGYTKMKHSVAILREAAVTQDSAMAWLALLFKVVEPDDYAAVAAIEFDEALPYILAGVTDATAIREMIKSGVDTTLAAAV